MSHLKPNMSLHVILVAVGFVLVHSVAPSMAGVQSVGANSDANRLYEDLMMSYNRFVRPVQNDSDLLVVKLGLKLSQLIDVVSIVHFRSYTLALSYSYALTL